MWEDKGGGKSMNAFKRIRLKTYAEYEILCTYPFLLLIFKKYDQFSSMVKILLRGIIEYPISQSFN